MKLLDLIQNILEAITLQSLEGKRRSMGVLSKIGWVAVLVFACGGTAISESTSWAGDESAQAKASGLVGFNATAKTKQEAFAVFKKHCVQCHDSVADPERPGKTRIEWYAIINLLMTSHGLEISQEEADIIADLLYSLRPADMFTPGLIHSPTIRSDHGAKD